MKILRPIGTRARLLAAAGVVAPLFFGGISASAQGVGEATTQTEGQKVNDPSNADSEPVPGDIIVTAQRRSENLQDVPISVSVVTGATLQAANIRTLQDLSGQQPNLKVAQGPASDQLHVRGIGSGFNPGFEQSVATFVDGVYRGRSRASRIALFDIDRIEILNGPQNTFFGANAIAGALNITTRKPATTFEANASALSAPTDGEYNLEAGAGGPISSVLGVRIAGRFSGMRGYIHNSRDNSDGPQTNDKQGRLSVAWNPSSTVSVDARIDVARLRGSGTSNFEIAGCPPRGGPPTGQCARVLGIFGSIDDKFDYDSAAGPSTFNLNLFEAAVTPTIEIGALTLISTTSYADQDVVSSDDVLPLPGNSVIGTPFFPFRRTEDFSQFSQELRLQSAAGDRLQYMVGAYFEDNKVRNDSLTGFFFAPFGAFAPGVTTPATPIGLVIQFQQKTQTLSGFGSMTFRPVYSLRLTAGARYSRVRKVAHGLAIVGTSNADISQFQPLPIAAQASISPRLGVPLSDFAVTRRVDAKFMPSANIQYDITDTAMAYASYAKGFKAGGFDPTGRVLFDPETVNAFELGLKTRWFDRRLTANVALFESRYRDLQEATVILLASGATTPLVANAARSRSRGVEFDGRLRVTDSFTLSSGVAYLDSVYTDYPNAPCTPAQVAATPLGCRQNLSGQRRAFSPKWSGSVSADLTVPFESDSQFSLGSTLAFSGSYLQQANLDQSLEQPGYAKLDMRAAIGDPDKRWELAVIAKNVTGTRTANFRQIVPTTAQTVFLLPDRPRSVAVQFATKW